MLEEVFNRLLARGNDGEGSMSFSKLVKAAALDPSRDFVGASLRDMDFRDEDLRGFDFSFADLSGSDFRRANVSGVSFKDAKLADRAIGLQPATGFHIFVSYRRLDDDPPPGSEKKSGFVAYLLRELRWELSQLGLPDDVLWLDRLSIEPGDIWSMRIKDELRKADLFLVILSKNYVQGTWCRTELEEITKVVDGRDRRIFRVDKHPVPEDKIPDPLRNIQSVRFYREDREGRVDDYFWRGKVRRSREYDNALRELAGGIAQRLERLGIERIR